MISIACSALLTISIALFPIISYAAGAVMVESNQCNDEYTKNPIPVGRTIIYDGSVPRDFEICAPMKMVDGSYRIKVFGDGQYITTVGAEGGYQRADVPKCVSVGKKKIEVETQKKTAICQRALSR